MGDKKENTFEMAKEIAATKGISKLTIRELAKKSNISVGTVYNFFGTKDELILLLIEDYWNHALKETLIKTENQKGSFIDKLEGLYKEFRKATNEFHKNWIKDLVSLQMSNPIVYSMSEFYKEAIKENIKELLDLDRGITIEFTEDFSKEKLASFIFDHIMLLLQEDKKDLDFLEIVLKKLLYI